VYSNDCVNKSLVERFEVKLVRKVLMNSIAYSISNDFSWNPPMQKGIGIKVCGMFWFIFILGKIV